MLIDGFGLGSGVTLETVSGFIKQFEAMRKMMRPGGMFGRMLAGGAMPEFTPGGGMQYAPAGLSRKEQEKRKKLAKLARKERQKQRKKKR